MSTWDAIIVGGGLAGCVVANQLYQKNSNLKILLVEAGEDVSDNEDIIQSSTTLNTPEDWSYMSMPQANLNKRPIYTASGKALGGGTVINGSAWVRGHSLDYDLWADLVGDRRWSYDAQLPYMKKTETFFDPHLNPVQHGHEGPMLIEGLVDPKLPVREHLEQSFQAMGIKKLPGFDANAGYPIGYGEIQSNRNDGRRQIASDVYNLDGVTALTGTMVEKVLLESANSSLKTYGVRLADGTEHLAPTVVLAAGAYRTPQVLMLSGIGPRETLQKHKISVLLDQPYVGQNLHDHIIMPTVWKVKPSSRSAVAAGKVDGFSRKIDFIATVSVPKEGLKAAIAQDSGAEPSPDHEMLRQARATVSHSLQYSGPPGAPEDAGAPEDGSLVTMLAVLLIATSRGSVDISSASIRDAPVIDPEYLVTEQDRYLAREALRFDARLLGSDATVLGRDILDGELVMPGQKALMPESTDEDIDERVRMSAGSCCHPAGTASMGKVVATDLSVKGVGGLFVADSSIFPISISANLQVAAYALALQAADIIASHINPHKLV